MLERVATGEVRDWGIAGLPELFFDVLRENRLLRLLFPFFGPGVKIDLRQASIQGVVDSTGAGLATVCLSSASLAAASSS